MTVNASEIREFRLKGPRRTRQQMVEDLDRRSVVESMGWFLLWTQADRNIT